MSGSPKRAPSRALLFIDVDGYCSSGIDQRQVVSAKSEGYRARELGWLYVADDRSESGSVYFRDIFVDPIATIDGGINYVYRMHGLPISPAKRDFAADEAVMCSTQLLEAIRIIYDSLAQVIESPITVLHKGGNEGLWALAALRGTSESKRPPPEVVDIATLGCPRVDAIAAMFPDRVADDHAAAGGACAHHDARIIARQARKKNVIHCPRLEVELMALWVAEFVDPASAIYVGAATAAAAAAAAAAAPVAKSQ
jgi:hypothetical protein